MKLKTLIITTILPVLLLFACKNNQPETSQTDTQDTLDVVNTMGSPLIEDLTKKIMAEPENAIHYAQRGEVYYSKDNFEAAITDYEQAVTLDSNNYAYHHLLADAYLDNFQSEEALKTLENVAKKAPERIQTLLKLSEFQLILRQYEASLETTGNILKQSPKHPEAYYMLGRNYKEMGDTARAVNSFQTTVEEDADHLDAYIELGILFDQLKKKVSLQYFDNALRIDSINFEALFGKAWYYHQRLDYTNASTWYEKTAKFHPKNSQVHLNNGILNLELSNIRKKQEEKKEALTTAFKKFDLATKVDPSYGLAYYLSLIHI